MIIEYRKARCDKCGKEEIVEGAGTLPFRWLTISLAETHGLMDNIILTKEVCSKKCAVAFMNKIRDIPKIQRRLRI
ncbi:MAG: hypothetical protein AABX34_04050 [Nanoarchaeota archaeon]